MENFNLDLNLELDEEEEFVPSTQYTEQLPFTTLFSLQPGGFLYTGEQQQHLLSSQPCVTRTPLVPISSNTPCQATPAKKATKGRKGTVSLPANKRSLAPNTTFLPVPQYAPPSNTKDPSFSSQPAPSKPTAPPNGDKPIPSKLFFRSGHWNLKETVILLDARAKLLEEMKAGNLGAVLKTQDERWEFISKYCVQHGALRSPDQRLFHWDRILASFKKIHDYERCIPSGKDSYWNMTSNEREEMKLPRSFAQDLYEAMLDRIGSEKRINPGNIVYDTSNDILEDACASPNKTTKVDKEEETLVEELSSGKSASEAIKCQS